MLIVDLDNSFLKTDILFESILNLLKQKPLRVMQLPFWAMGGALNLKQKVAFHSKVTISSLPVRQSVLDLIESKKSLGVKVILISASPQEWVDQVAQRISVFDLAIGSMNTNLKGERKLEVIQELGVGSFSYVGDSAADLAIWDKSFEVIAINPSSGFKKTLLSRYKNLRILEDRNSVCLSFLQELRPEQWLKNSLLFLPLLAAHELTQFNLNSVLAFVTFCCAASSVYVFNDLLDLESDRQHHTKKNRPFASGELSLKFGMLMLPFMVLASLGLAWVVGYDFLFWICAYFSLNLLYTFKLKTVLVFDIVVLSAMYTLRLFAGSAATDVMVSEWFLSFSTMFFFSLACVKRYTEIIRSKTKLNVSGRGYRQVDDSSIMILGAGSGLLSIVIFLLYLQSSAVQQLYPRAQVLWFITPILLYWISRLWVLTNRNEINDDPVIFAAKDPVSWVCFLGLAIVMGIAAL